MEKEVLKVYLRSEIQLAQREETEGGLYKVRGKFVSAGVVERGWFKLEITDEALGRAFATAMAQGKIHAKYMHEENEIIGHATGFVLEDGFIKGDYFINPKVQRGAETIALIEGKTLDAFSVGFAITEYVTKANASDVGGEETLVVNDFRINEISVVDIPAVDAARIEEGLRMTFKQVKEGGKMEKGLEKEKESGSLSVEFSKDALFAQIEAFTALGKTYGVSAEDALAAAKQGLSDEAFKASILEKKTEEFRAREAKLRIDEEALKAKQVEADETFRRVNAEFGATLKKGELPLGDASKVEGESQEYTGVDRAVQKLREEMK